jgi:hypothetical protein
MTSHDKITWKQFCLAKKAPFNEDLDAINCRVTAERRPVMAAFLAYAIESPKRPLDMLYKIAEERGSRVLHQIGQDNISYEAYEYQMDNTVWKIYFRQLPEGGRPAFPWGCDLLRDFPDMPLSAKHQQWLADNGKLPSTEATSPTEAPRGDNNQSASELAAVRINAITEILGILCQNSTIKEKEAQLKNWVFCTNHTLGIADAIDLVAATWTTVKGQQDEAIAAWVLYAQQH